MKTWSALCSTAELQGVQDCAQGQVPRSSYCRIKPFPSFPPSDIFICLTQGQLQMLKATIKAILSLCTALGDTASAPHFLSDTLRLVQAGGASGCLMGLAQHSGTCLVWQGGGWEEIGSLFINTSGVNDRKGEGIFNFFLFIFSFRTVLAQEQMVINWPQINLGWKLGESPNQQSREVLEQLCSWSSSRQNRTAVKMVVDNYMKCFISYACAKKTLAGKRRRSFPILLALQCLSVPP